MASVLLTGCVVFATPALAQDVPPAGLTADYARWRVEVAAEPARVLAEVQQAKDFGPVEELRQHLLAEAAIAAGRLDVAVDALAWLFEGAQDGTDRFAAGIERAELLVLLGRADEARAQLDDLGRAEPEGRRADSRHLAARRARLRHDLALAAGQGAAASSYARALLTRYPAEDATRRPGLSVSVNELDDAATVRRGLALYEAWAYEEARATLEPFADHEEHAATVRWHLADIALNRLRDDPVLAEELYGELAAGRTRFAEAAHYQYARAQMRQERYDDALDTLEAYQARYPRGTWSEAVDYYRGWLPYDHRENERAIQGFEQYIDKRGYRTARSSLVIGFWAWAHIRQQQWQQAIDVYERLHRYGNMLVEGKALYWQAYAHLQLDEREQAIARLDRLRQRYPVTYYGMLGEQLRATIEGNDPTASKVWWPEGAGQADDRPRVDVDGLPLARLSAADRERWQKVRWFVELGEPERAREAFLPMRRRVFAAVPAGQQREWIHALGQYVGDYHTMWNEVTGGSISAMPRLPDTAALETVMAYPRAYRQVVERATSEFELPPELMWGIMRQESRYRPGQISHTDAVGALQMIPATARRIADELEVDYNVRTFHRPEVGFRFSAYYMRRLLDVFDQRVVLMAGAYNSGPDVIKRWVEKNPEGDFAGLIEEFEYNEGRNYARKVTEHMLRYLYIYEDDPERRGRWLDRMFPLDRAIELPDDVGY
ncbi:tetratricopeptide repeat protein [Lujinxingia vulgaris]|uniref:Tetratricopeptide repeat protein n=1 Tax=Lujinxingia vulgaris TaxID=2600176 RepID=A0A5C6XDP3_9DELT|nr:transglycosylase SLT domain-containing protein [Lujinxingia vulgaris]TXD36902.1 tetratricopeptide repeat protein [Lujinxingia vulgaris]